MEIIELEPADLRSDRPWQNQLITLYRNAFPAAERHPEALVLDRLQRGRERAIVGVMADQLVMMALLWPLGTIEAATETAMIAEPEANTEANTIAKPEAATETNMIAATIAEPEPESEPETGIGAIGVEPPVSALATGEPLRAVLLDYFATDSQVRGQGLGATTLDYLARRCRDRREWIILEVEDPNHASSATERALCDRRIAFYRRAGAQFLAPLPYRLPPLNETNLTTPMQLGILPGWPHDTFPAAIARTLVATLYWQLCDRGLDDPYLQSFIGQIRDPIQLR